ncbi:MAG TPA: phosphopantetheine-binding protein [Streptosporangiaceae bacterium]|nr:phosphopantetheine-binding protein [Streptosporangiaceae bacterium]
MKSTEDAVRDLIRQELTALLTEAGVTEIPLLADDDVLLDTGLDSLGFVVLVTRLEDALGYDPFTEMAEAVYPLTLGEFVQVYAATPAVTT